MKKALRLKSGELINPERFEQEQLIEFCAAGGLWEDVEDGFFAPVEAVSAEDNGGEEDGEDKQPPASKAAAKKAAAKKAADRNSEGEE